MSREQLVERLKYFINKDNGIGAVLYFVMDENGESMIRFADIEDNTKHELKDRFLEYLEDQFLSGPEFVLNSISEAQYEGKAVAYQYDLDERPETLSILSHVLHQQEQLPFRFDELSLDRIKGYLITIGNDERKMVLYKKHHAINLLRQDRFLLMPHQQRLQKVECDVIAFDRTFDFMLVDDALIIHKLATLERFFGFEQVIRRQAAITLQQIACISILDDCSALAEFAQNITYARKLMNMRRSPVLQIPTESVIRFIKSHPELGTRLKFNEQGSKIVLDTVVAKKLFLKILNDDFLTSQLTDVLYDSQSKNPLSNTV